jgi:lysophospholipase L1-like esterase
MSIRNPPTAATWDARCASSCGEPAVMRRALPWMVAGLVGTAACGGPAAPTTDAPSIACPAPQVAQSPTGQAVVVSYPAPTTTGGEAPVATACAPASGATFPVGTTNVTCTATDARRRGALCSFSVQVEAPPRLQVERFLAFGDSITQGVTAECVRSSTGSFRILSHAEDTRILLEALDPTNAYPTLLETMLKTRYTAQLPAVTNAGSAGEYVTASTTRSRFQNWLVSAMPQVVLLQEGVNDLHGGMTAVQVAEAVRALVRDARARNIQVLVGTLLPERPGSCRAYAPAAIEPANQAIRLMAVGEGVGLVDLYAEFVGRTAELLGEDGLHPSPAGYARIAELFFDRIRAALEEPRTTPALVP